MAFAQLVSGWDVSVTRKKDKNITSSLSCRRYSSSCDSDWWPCWKSCAWASNSDSIWWEHTGSHSRHGSTATLRVKSRYKLTAITMSVFFLASMTLIWNRGKLGFVSVSTQLQKGKTSWLDGDTTTRAEGWNSQEHNQKQTSALQHVVVKTAPTETTTVWWVEDWDHFCLLLHQRKRTFNFARDHSIIFKNVAYFPDILNYFKSKQQQLCFKK